MKLERTRKKMRLSTWDYGTPGYYFVTICVNNRENILCQDIDISCRGAQCAPVQSLPGQFPLSRTGEIVQQAIAQISRHYSHVRIDKYVVMPNHIHMILILSNVDDNGRTLCAPTVSRIIKHMKEYTTKSIGYSIWQKSFHDHIIRNEQDYQRIWTYIDTNPLNREQDCYYSKE